MKTAEEFFEELKKEPTDKNLERIAYEFLGELPILGLGEAVRKEPRFFPMLEEQRQKWLTFYALVSSDLETKSLRVRADGFERMVKQQYPDVYGAWFVINSDLQAGTDKDEEDQDEHIPELGRLYDQLDEMRTALLKLDDGRQLEVPARGLLRLASANMTTAQKLVEQLHE